MTATEIPAMISPEAMQRMKTKVQGRVASTPPGTWGRMGAGVLLGGVAIGWLVFPYLLDKVIARVSIYVSVIFIVERCP